MVGISCIPAPSGSIWLSISVNHFVLQGGSPDDYLGIRTPMDSEQNSDVKDAKGRPGRIGRYDPM